jgi:hypothetical protein
VKVRKLVVHTVALVVFAVSPNFAFGQPPPQQDPEPGVVASQAV